MAENLSDESKKKQLLDEQNEVQQRIEERNKRMALAGQDEIKRLKKRNEQDKEHIKNLKEELKVISDSEKKAKEYTDVWEKALKRQDDYSEAQNDFQTSFSRLGKDVQTTLQKSTNESNAFSTITGRILELKKEQINASDEEYTQLQKRIDALSNIRSQQEAAAESMVEAKKHAHGISEAEKRKQKYQRDTAGLTGKDKAAADASFKAKEKLLAAEEKIKAIHEQQHKMAHILPESVQSALGFMKEMGSVAKSMSLKVAGTFLLAGALMAAFHAFQELDKAAEDYRKETGMTVSQTEELGHQAHHIEMYYRKVGVELKDVYDTANSLANTFSDVVGHSEQTLAAISLMKSNFGVTTQTGAEVQGIFEQIGGLSQQAAANVQLQTLNLAKQLKVSPKEMMEDIAKSAGITSKYFKGDVTLLVKQAAEAKRLGTNLQEVEKTAENLLDFENSIEKELVAATFVGGQFNLSRARALAYEGKIVDAQNATLDAIEASGDFASKDVFTQKALADASNMTVEQINKQLAMRKQLANLSDMDKKAAQDAIDKGLDISNLNEEQLKQKVKEFSQQQEMNGALTKMEDQFKGIIAQLGGTLMPIMTALVPVMEMLFKPLQWAVSGIQMFVDGLKQGKAGAIAMAVVLSPLLISMVGSAISAIFAGLSWLGPFGVPLAVAAVAGFLSTMKSAKAEAAGDIMSPADGKTQVSTKEGGLYELSKNDDFVAFPGASKAFANQQGQPQAASVVASSNNNMIGALIQEFRGVRADMQAGKIGVYMDGDSVTAGVAKVVGRGTRNDFALQ
jgi:hypothetical protein